MQVAIPEFDGRIIGVPISFKEPIADLPFEALHYAPDAERCDRLARLAVNHARLRTLDRARAAHRRSSSPPSRPSTRGSATRSASTRPPARWCCWRRCRQAGHRVEHDFADGDALIHALIAAGGHDPEFLTDTQLAQRHRAAPGRRLRATGSTRCPTSCASRWSSTWGPPPGERYVDGDDFVIAGLELGNVFVAIQPPRGYGENPVAIYHDPEPRARPPLPRDLPLADAAAPTRSSTSASTARSSGCRARRSGSATPARPTPASATSRSSTRSSSTTPARACRPSAAPTRS